MVDSFGRLERHGPLTRSDHQAEETSQVPCPETFNGRFCCEARTRGGPTDLGTNLNEIDPE